MSTSSSGELIDFDASDDAFALCPWPATTEGESPRKTPRTLAPNLTRRSHKKSRGGCFNCKSRKIKCQETKPSCENCSGKDLDCIYPSKADQRLVRRTCTSKANTTATVKQDEPRLPPTLSPPTSFSMDDMRCFHHFLTVAYPHLPLGNDSVWVQEIPIFAQQHEYLMHALLALGASHLTRVSPQNDYSTKAIIHRGLAIKGLNAAISQPLHDYGEADALLAACYALTFQASYMGDGMSDFITMVRGCALVTGQIQSLQSRTAFNISSDAHLRLVEQRLSHLPILAPSLITPAIHSTQSLQPLLRTSTDHTFHRAILSVLLALQPPSPSPKTAYLNYLAVYHTFYAMSHDQFSVFVDPSNVAAQLLMAHFIALQLLMVPLTLHEWPQGAYASKARVLLGMVEWGERIFERADRDVRRYLEWPRGIMDAVRREVEALQAGRYGEFELKILDP